MTPHVLLLLALCFTQASSQDGGTNNQSSCEQFGQCKSHDLSVRLGSSVLLPCDLPAPTPPTVSWVKIQESFLVHLTSRGRVSFVAPREGRVKVFPNGAPAGNFSIRLDHLQASDLGSYCCQNARRCVQVNLVKRGLQVKTLLMWVSVCVAPVVFILLLAGYFRCIKGSRSMRGVTPGGGEAVKETHSQPTQESQTGPDNQVYENDSHCPAYRQLAAMANQSGSPAGVMAMGPPTHHTGGAAADQNQMNRDRMESQRRKWRFHTEMFNRLRPASFSRHYYVNQAELSHSSKQVGQRSQVDMKYNNPVYNWDTEDLSQQ